MRTSRPGTKKIWSAFRNGGFDFLDLGCRFGGSVKFDMKYFEGRSSVRVDIDRELVYTFFAKAFFVLDIFHVL